MDKGQFSLKMIFLGLMVVVVVIIFAYGYKYTVGMKNKMKTEGFMQEAEIPDDYTQFEMPNPNAEKIDCFVGAAGQKKIYKNMPVILCPADLDKIEEKRIAYEAYRINNGTLRVTSVQEVPECEKCYDILLSDGFSEKTVKMKGLMERES